MKAEEMFKKLGFEYFKNKGGLIHKYTKVGNFSTTTITFDDGAKYFFVADWKEKDDKVWRYY